MLVKTKEQTVIELLEVASQALERRMEKRRAAFEQNQDQEVLRRGIEEDMNFYREAVTQARILLTELSDDSGVKRGPWRQLMETYRIYQFTLQGLVQEKPTSSPVAKADHRLELRRMLKRWTDLQTLHSEELEQLQSGDRALVERHRRHLTEEIAEFCRQARHLGRHGEKLVAKAQAYLASKNVALDRLLSTNRVA